MTLPPRTKDLRYDLRQRMNRAVAYLRDAEDIARVEMPAWPTADRIRSIYEQISEDLLNGRTTVPPVLERLERGEAAARELGTALRDALELADEGWAYASEYFHTKWGYEERRAAILAVIDKFPGYGSEEAR